MVLGGTVVRLNGEPVPLYYVSPGQINFVVPKSLAGGVLVVVREGVPSTPLALLTALVAPAIFTQDGMPRGQAAARHAGTPGMPVVTSQAPALPGEWIALFLTGLGVRNPMIMAPETLPAVRVGELQAEVGFFGAAPGFPGLNQINFKVPPASPSGQLPLTVTVGSVQSNAAALAVGAQNRER